MRISFFIYVLTVLIVCFGCAKKGGEYSSQIDSAHFPSTITTVTETRGTRAIFNELVEEGKIDPGLAKALSHSKNKDVISHVLVLLDVPPQGKVILKSLVEKNLSDAKVINYLGPAQKYFKEIDNADLASAGLDLSFQKTNILSKQIFTSQLVLGLSFGDFKNVEVLQDLKNSPALTLKGQARDIFKIAQLPNVKGITLK